MKTATDVEEFTRRAQARFTSKCKLCDGQGVACKCRKKALWWGKLYESCIPRDFWTLTEKQVQYNAETYRTVIQKYTRKLDVALKNGYGVMFSGDNGVGKTTFISLILKKALRSGYSVYYTTLPDLVYQLSKGFRDYTVSKRIEWYLSSDFVAIDEIGKDKVRNKLYATEFHFERILKKRFDDSAPTLLASNLDMRSIKEAYGKTVESVLIGKYQVIAMEAGDFRSKLRNRMFEEMEYDG